MTITSEFSIKDPIGYIDPCMQDMLFTDITQEELSNIANILGITYLSIATIFPGSFPVTGQIYGSNKRAMVNLICKARDNSSLAINVIFLIDTGSPASYLSEKAMLALVGKPGSNVVRQLPVMIHSTSVIQCHLSPPDKHFADVNVLGADFLFANGITFTLRYKELSCSLTQD